MSSSLMGVVIPTNRIDDFALQMSNWIANCLELGIQVILVVDSPVPTRRTETESVLSGLTNPLFEMVTGDYRSPGVARNAGLAKIDSKWICFWDCDDYPNPKEMLAEITIAESRGSAILIGSYEIEESNPELETKIVKIHERGNLDEIFMSPGIWRFAFNRSQVNIPEFTEFRMGEDQVFLASIEIAKRPIYFSQVCVYRYRKHAIGSLTANTDAWRDLRSTIGYMFLKLSASKGKDRRLIWIATTNQVLSYMRRERFPNQLAIGFSYFLKLVFHPTLILATVFVAKKKIRIERNHGN